MCTQRPRGGSDYASAFDTLVFLYICPESDDEDEAESRAKRARKVPFALLPEEDLAALRDEVERVITHR